MSRIVITYPPEYDGELHIEVEKLPRGGVWNTFDFSFIFSTKIDNEWDALVQVAKDILAQEERRKSAAALLALDRSMEFKK